jgi:hypothetical protein
VKPEDRTPESIRAALDDLVQSEGWAILRELVEAQFGSAAQLQQIDAAMMALQPADTMGQLAVVTQIRAASKAAYAVLDLPASKLRAVAEKQPAARMFDQFRRAPRPA